jgi:hypothetical protein
MVPSAFTQWSYIMAKAPRKNPVAATVAPPVTVHDGAPLASIVQPNGATVIIPETATKAPATSVTFVVTDQTRSALMADGAAAYDGETSLLAFAAVFQPYMATATQQGNLDAYNECARLWKVGYEAERRNILPADVTAISDRAQAAFERRMRAAMSEDGLGKDRLIGTKPKAATAESTKKAAQREGKASKIEALAKSASPQDLLKQSAAASLKGDAGAALDLLTAAKRAQADADKAARDAAATEIEKHASTIRAALRRLEKSGDVKALAALAKVALKCSPEPAAAPV